MISFMVLAQTVKDVFGKVESPPGSQWGENPITGIGTLVLFLIQIFLLIGGLAALFYMLWGAFDWINSGGDPDNIAKARQKITHALIGIVLTVVVLGIFVLISTDVLKIIRKGPNGEWLFNIPTINKCVPVGGTCDPLGASQCCGTATCNATSKVCQ